MWRGCSCFSDYVWEATDLGNCPKKDKSQKWSGEGATSLSDPGTKGLPSWLLVDFVAKPVLIVTVSGVLSCCVSKRLQLLFACVMADFQDYVSPLIQEIVT